MHTNFGKEPGIKLLVNNSFCFFMTRLTFFQRLR